MLSGRISSRKSALIWAHRKFWNTRVRVHRQPETRFERNMGKARRVSITKHTSKSGAASLQWNLKRRRYQQSFSTIASPVWHHTLCCDAGSEFSVNSPRLYIFVTVGQLGTISYYTETSCQIERYTWTILANLGYYISEHPKELNTSWRPLSMAYDTWKHRHRSISITFVLLWDLWCAATSNQL